MRRRARAFHDAGGLLDRLIARNDREGAFDELAVALLASTQLALGIAHMHAHGVIHRDLKARRPRRRARATLPLARASRRRLDGTCRACAAGQHLHEPQRRTQDRRPRGLQAGSAPGGVAVRGAYGSALYLCPEVWCLRACTEKSDVWSLGCVVYELMALRPPFSAPELAHKVLNASPQPLPAGCSVELRDLVGRMLEKDPERRISWASCSAGRTCSAISRAGCASPAHHRRGLRATMRSRGRRATTWARVGA